MQNSYYPHLMILDPEIDTSIAIGNARNPGASHSGDTPTLPVLASDITLFSKSATRRLAADGLSWRM
ncbi:MAG: hypothetical protein JWM58_4628 [Rhizobium sp.]|nr:hypothetical protein [Rhizobium sp.]